jgi:hypothetical protein
VDPAHRMLYLVRGVPFALKAIAHLFVVRQVRVEDLHRRARPIPVTRGVDGHHAADAKKALQRPFVVEHAPYSSASSGVWVLAQPH